MPDSTETALRPAAAIILAAGQSKRMHSKLPKMLHPVCGLPITAHVIRACHQAGVEKVVVVVRHQAEAVKAGLGDSVEYALQSDEPGTGAAVRAAQPLLGNWPGTVLVLLGDMPLLPADTITRLRRAHERDNAALTLMTVVTDGLTDFGRVVRAPQADNQGHVLQIVEAKDCTPEQFGIREKNPSIYAFHSAQLWSALQHLTRDNVQNEYLLTDTVAILNQQGQRVEAIAVEDADDVYGINQRVQLAECRAIMNRRLLNKLMLSGVTVTDPANTYVDVDVEIGPDSVIEPNTYLLRGAKIGTECVVGPMTRIENSVLGNGVRVLASQVVDSVLEDGVRVGPYANLRPGTHLGKKVKIGDFVETKNARFHDGAQASHLSYIGDAEIGEGTNIGGGTITCNYDGYKKHRTVIGKRAFIGSNSTLVAPITVGDGAFVAAASALTTDVPNDAMGIARSRPTIKEGWAAQYHARQAQEKASSESNHSAE